MDPSEPTNSPENENTNNPTDNPQEAQNPETQPVTDNTDSVVEDDSTSAQTEVVPGSDEVESTPETATTDSASLDQEPPTAAYNPFGNTTTPSETTQPVSSSGLTPKKSGKKKWLAPVIAAIIAVVVLGGAASAYAFWYQNPNKVLSDALVHSLSAKDLTYTATLDSTSNGNHIKLTLDGKTNADNNQVSGTVTLTGGGKDLTFKGDGILTKDGTIYMKVTDTKNMIKSVVDAYSSANSDSISPDQAALMEQMFSNIADKIDNKWIKITAADTGEFSEQWSKTQTCVTKAFDDFRSNKDSQNEVANLYTAHPLLKVKNSLGAKNGSLGYTLEDSSDATAKDFLNGLKDTKIYKQIHDCDNSFTIDADQLVNEGNKSNDNGTAQVWVSRWSHQFTKLSISADEDGDNTSLTINPSFNQNVDIKIPTDTMTVDELKSALQEAVMQIYMQSYDTTSGAGSI